jgi:hypothetical protein
VQSAFQIFLAVVDAKELIQKCEFLEILLRHVGLVKLDELDAISIIQWLSPEIISFFGSIIIFITLKRASSIQVHTDDQNDDNNANHHHQPLPLSDDNPFEIGYEKWNLFLRVGKVFSLITLCATGALQPSALSGVYYLVFLGGATWWGMNKQLERAFGFVLRIVVVFLMFHITTYLAYQNPWPQEFLQPNSTIPRFVDSNLL